MEAEWMAAMRRGDFAAAWAISDAVLAARDPQCRDDPRLPYHLRWVWDGRDYRGRDVLVRCYHGLGDTIQFARYLPVLRQLVASLTVEVQPALLPLLAAVPGPDRLAPFKVDAPLPPSECDFEIMELAHALRLPPEEAPAPPYIAASPASVPSGGIGLCWRSGDWDPARSVPDHLIHRLIQRVGSRLGAPFDVSRRTPQRTPLGAPLRTRRRDVRAAGDALGIPPGTPLGTPLGAPLHTPAGTVVAPSCGSQGRGGLAIYTLQPEPTTLAVRNPSGAPSIVDTAALIAGLDLVITVDTMAAHLAGALNRPTWLLLKHDADWRWAVQADRSPWYPSMRLYRQPAPGDWESVIARVAADLTRCESRGGIRAGC